jgi:hypothetical protein
MSGVCIDYDGDFCDADGDRAELYPDVLMAK